MDLRGARPLLVAGAAVLLAHAGVSLLVPHSLWTAAFGNVLQSVLLAVLLALTLLNVAKTRGQARVFWASMALAAALWLAATLTWTWVELVLRHKVPITFFGDVLFFLHVVPMMAALAARPHRPEQHRRLDFGGMDNVLLLLWWVYLYLVIVIPWQYVSADEGQYGFSFNLLYVIENAILLAVLLGLCVRTRGDWRRMYAVMLTGACVYTVGSQVANGAISRGTYYTGSVYDLPLVTAMLIFIGVAWMAYRQPPQPMSEEGAGLQAVIASRLAMLAVISLPFIAFWASYANTPERVKWFRLVVTTGALVVLPVLVFLKQHLLDRELVRLWSESQHSYNNLKRLQAQLVQAEKLASLGQLVSGAAHEINNPLTAILGYSDLLSDGPGVPEEKKSYINKIRQQANRVREVVANLRAFAKQIPGKKTRVEVNPLVANAIELCLLDLNGNRVRIEQELASDLPPVLGDGNGLLQVCFHIIGNAVDALRQVGGGVLRVSSYSRNGQVVLEFVDSGPGVKNPQRIFDPFYTTKPVGAGTGLGLSACYGIVQDHKGEIVCENLPGGGAKFTVILPAMEAVRKPPAGVSVESAVASRQ